MFCRGPMSHLDFLGRVRISYKSTSITGGTTLYFRLSRALGLKRALGWRTSIKAYEQNAVAFPVKPTWLPLKYPLGWFPWWFPKNRGTPKSSIYRRMFHCKSTILGSPATMATRIYRGKYRRPTFRISSVRGILPRVASAMLRTRGKWEHHMGTPIQKSPCSLTPLLARLYNWFLSLKGLCLYP